MSVPATHWDETILAFEGNVRGGQTCVMVEWPQMAFQQAVNGGALQVPTLANLDALFNADPLLDLVGLFAAGEVGTELICTRNIMCVPPKYVPILLSQALTPWEAYLHISGAIWTDGLEANCGSLLAYLWAACT